MHLKLSNTLHHLSVSPSTCWRCTCTVLINLGRKYASSPPPDCIWRIISSPSDIDTQCMLEQLGRLLPLVGLELPGLSCSEDSHNPIPVLWLELLRGVHKNKPNGASRVNGGDQALCMQKCRGRARRCADRFGWHIHSILKECLDV